MAIDTLNYSNMITCNEITGEITAHKRKIFFWTIFMKHQSSLQSNL